MKTNENRKGRRIRIPKDMGYAFSGTVDDELLIDHTWPIPLRWRMNKDPLVREEFNVKVWKSGMIKKTRTARAAARDE